MPEEIHMDPEIVQKHKEINKIADVAYQFYIREVADAQKVGNLSSQMSVAKVRTLSQKEMEEVANNMAKIVYTAIVRGTIQGYYKACKDYEVVPDADRLCSYL